MIILRIPLLRRKLTLVIKLKSLGDLITQRRNKMKKMQLIAYTKKYGTKAYVNFKELYFYWKNKCPFFNK